MSGLQVSPPYVCLVYATETVSPQEMATVAEWLVSSGCKYAVCAGEQCSQWHDAIDLVGIVADIESEPSHSQYIMTSWHTNESIEEVVWFWLNLTDYGDFNFQNYVALIVGQPGDLQAQIIRASSENEL
jgi:hypothetical protein